MYKNSPTAMLNFKKFPGGDTPDLASRVEEGMTGKERGRKGKREGRDMGKKEKGEWGSPTH